MRDLTTFPRVGVLGMWNTERSSFFSRNLFQEPVENLTPDSLHGNSISFALAVILGKKRIWAKIPSFFQCTDSSPSIFVFLAFPRMFIWSYHWFIWNFHFIFICKIFEITFNRKQSILLFFLFYILHAIPNDLLDLAKLLEEF